MEKVLIYDVAAEYGGAEAILQKFHKTCWNNNKDDITFVVSRIKLNEKSNLRVISLPWVKKSWFHRLFCDIIYMPCLVRKLKIEKVVSLQNIPLPFIKTYQLVYVHNAIPFSKHRFKLKESKYLWFYQKLIGKIIKRSLRKADQIIVQNDWMKEAVSRNCHISEDVIKVERIRCFRLENVSRIEVAHRRFFFPGGESIYKNHKCIIKACYLLHKRGMDNYEVIFTLNSNCNTAKEVLRLFKGGHTPFRFMGYLSQEEMKRIYLSSILVFPSYLETVGLPINEAITFSAPLIVADCNYARDTVGEYKNVKWFDPYNPEELAEIMSREILKKQKAVLQNSETK